MRRRIAGLHDADQSRAGEVPDGLFLVRVERAQHRWNAHKPYNWFLRDFGYEAELLGRGEIDDKNLVGLRGVVKISHAVVNGTSLLNLDGFATAAQWELRITPLTNIGDLEVA
jgi:hypothetical protein